MVHRPLIDGIFLSLTSIAVKRFAANGYGAPRVPREYMPSIRLLFSVASSFVPYSSKLNASVPLAKLPVVDVTFSSPLKNDPFGDVQPAPAHAISKRNGTS